MLPLLQWQTGRARDKSLRHFNVHSLASGQIYTSIFAFQCKMNVNEIIQTTPMEALRKQFFNQFFLYHDYIKENQHKPAQAAITFQQWLTTTDCSEDKQKCYNRMDARVATMNAAKIASEAAYLAAAAAPVNLELLPVENTRQRSRSVSDSNSIANSRPIAIVKPKQSTSARVIRSDHVSATDTAHDYTNSRSFSASSSSVSSSRYSSSSSASTSTSSSTTVRSRGKIKNSSEPVFVPNPQSISEQDVNFFNMKVIEQECSWPMECKCSTENLTTFKEMICQKVDKVCKYFFSFVNPGPNVDETARKRYFCDGEPFSPTIGWSPYQLYCGIDACYCEKDFGIPHFLYDASSISRDIPYSVLIDKDPNNEESIKIKEALYQKMKKENGLGKKVWQNAKNRVSTFIIYIKAAGKFLSTR